MMTTRREFPRGWRLAALPALCLVLGMSGDAGGRPDAARIDAVIAGTLCHTGPAGATAAQRPLNAPVTKAAP